LRTRFHHFALAARARGLRRPGAAAAGLFALAGWAALAYGGHELPFYPGYYPQEIRLDAVAPAKAATLLKKSELHAYVGVDPFDGRADPGDIGSAESLGGYLVVTVNPASRAAASRENRCGSAARVVRALAASKGAFVPHPYPVTPYDADYLNHFDLIQSWRRADQAAGSTGSTGALKLRAKGPVAEKILGSRAAAPGAPWDASVEEVSLDELLAPGRIAVNGWLGPPWLKRGWYHAYLLQAAAMGDPGERQAVEAIRQRLETGGYGDLAEKINLERALVSKLVAGCERAVAGYTLRRERFSTEFSQGVENVAWDSQSGLNSAVFVRTVKLKDFPWNGWLRIGTPGKPAAAWNPIAGFSDPAGRLAWAALGDPALLPAPYGGGWADNRVAPGSATIEAAPGLAVPEDALLPDPASGTPREVGKGRTARARVTYRVRASAFHDNTRMGAADAVYAYLFAARWGAKRPPGASEHDPAVEASTALARKSLAGFRVLKVESEVKKWGDMTFTYSIPVVEVYLDAAGDPEDLAALAPPWSPVPWHVTVLMEEAVKRGMAAFSAEEARRRGVRWLDLARDPKLRDALLPVLDGFAKEAYVPEALRRFVTADDAQTRWTALRQFAKRRGHLLVTNGPYELARWTDGGVTLEVFRDFSNPMGVGSFDRFAIPRRAYVTRAAQRGDRLEVQVEIERVEKFLRSYKIAREPLGSPDEDKADTPACRYVVVGADGVVVAAGTSRERQGDRLVVPLKGRLKPGGYTVLLALDLEGNEVDPEIAAAQYRVEGAP
jgi:hypothetical protein